ncbi:MAG: glycosyltransferase family 87 protein [Pseudomonadota bacterium]
MTRTFRARLKAMDALARKADLYLNRIAFDHSTLARAIGAVLAGLAVAYVVYLGVVQQLTEVDFKYVWYAGEMWNAGESPYDPAFKGAASGTFLVGNELHRWLYPPNWWPISSALALLDYETAAWLWRFLTAASIVAATVLAYLSLRKTHPEAGLLVLGILLFLAVTAQATPTLLYLGQTTMTAGLGLALILYGWSHERRSAVITGLVLAMLKPQIGILGVALLGMSIDQWRNIVIAGVISLVMAAPAFWNGGILGVATGFLDALSDYGTLAVNAPAATTGFPHILDAVTGLEVGTVTMIVPALVTVAAMKQALDRLISRELVRAEDAALLSVAGIAIATCFWIPLHGYDLVIYSLAVPVIFVRCPVFCKIGIIIGMLGIWRAKKVSKVLGWQGDAATIDAHMRLLSLSLAAAGVIFFTALFVEAWRAEQR